MFIKHLRPVLLSAVVLFYAAQLSAQSGKPWTAVGVRQLLHRARNLFADVLVEEVARSLESSGQDELEQELVDLDLLSYCQAALERRKKDRP